MSGERPVGDVSRTPWRSRVEVHNSPIAVARMLQAMALSHIQVVSLFTHVQSVEDTQQVDMFLSAPAALTHSSIVELLQEAASHVIVAPGAEADAEDIATAVLLLATRLVDDPASAPQAAARLVLASSWEVTSATQGDAISPLVMRLQWTPERHVLLRREQAPFTRTERDRASALLALVQSAAVASGVDDGFGWTEIESLGTEVQIRLARPGDAEQVAAMHARCSEASLFQRYFAPVNEWREEQLHRLTGGHRGATLVVTDNEGTVVGLGNVFPNRPGESDVAEIAMIVEDRYQGTGLGTRLLARLIELAPRLGFARLEAYVLADNRRMQRLLDDSEVEWVRRDDHELGQSVVRFDASLD